MSRMEAKRAVGDRESQNRGDSMRVWTLIARYGTVGALLVTILVLSVIAPGFLSMSNLLTILRQISVLGIMSLGMTLVIAAGGIDLSVGAAADVGGLVCMSAIAAGWGWIPAVLSGLVAGALLGVLNATLIAGFDITPFLATLGTHSMMISLEMAYTKGGLPIYIMRAMPRCLAWLGRGLVGPVPAPVVLLGLTAVLVYVIFHRTTLGRYISAVGHNREASRLSGTNVELVTSLAYVMASAIAAFAGIIMASRVSSGQPLAGEAYLLDVIAAVFMGRTLSAEGEPNIVGSLVGAAFLGTILNGMTLLNVVFYMQTFIKGALLLAVIALGSYAKTRRA